MTSRVIECQRIPIAHATRRRPPSAGRPSARVAGFKSALLVGVMLLIPAGAAERPYGWLAGLVAALALLCLLLIAGRAVRWGWLAIVAALAGVGLPRGQFAAMGPALFVATGVCLTLWLANRGRRRARVESEPPPGSHEREAQISMGRSGERLVGRVLAEQLPEECVLINGLTLPRGAGDIDHLVVGPTGLFVIETKTMAGRIECGPDGTWRRTRVGRAGTAYAAFIGDPARQVRRNISAARECLLRRAPALYRWPPLWIEGMLVFPHPRTELRAEHSSVPAALLEQVTPRICQHAPKRRLTPTEVHAVVEALLQEAGISRQEPPLRRSAQALVELALLLPVLLGLVLGIVAVSRVVQAQSAVVAIAHEAARAGALARTPADAIERMRERVTRLAPGLGLDPRAVVLESDVNDFGSEPPMVVARVRYPLAFGDLPLLGWLPVPGVRAEHVEWIDPFRSGATGGQESTLLESGV